jgi:hypothetical protein
VTDSELNHHDRDDRRPLTWISVVGHRQFWSLAMLNSFTQKCGPNPYPDTSLDRSLLKAEKQEDFPSPRQTNPPSGKAELTTAAESSAVESSQVDGSCAGGLTTLKDLNSRSWFQHPGPALPGEMMALLIVCVTLSVGHGLLCWKGSMIGTPRVRAYFAPVPRIQHPVLVFWGSLILGLLALTLAATTGLAEQIFFNAVLDRWANIFILAAVIVITACACVGVVSNYALPVLSGNLPQRDAEAGKGSAPPTEPPLSSSETKDQGAERVYWKRQLGKWGNWLGQRRKPQAWILGVAWLLTLVLLSAVRYERLNLRLSPFNFVPFILRNVHFRNGVSGLLPQVLLILGMYAWFWYTLQGLSLFGDDRPVLPPLSSLPDWVTKRNKFESQDDDVDRREALKKVNAPDPCPPRDGSEMLGFRMFSKEEAGKPIEKAAIPLASGYLRSLVACVIVSFLVCLAGLGEPYLRTLGDRRFGALIFICVFLLVGVILADTLQFLRIWGRLRQLLVFLDRLRLRRTLSSLKGMSWDSVWSVSGNVLEERYRLISRQFESAQNLQNELLKWQTEGEEENNNRRVALQQLEDCMIKGFEFAEWYVNSVAIPDGKKPVQRPTSNVTPLKEFQEILAKTGGRIMGRVILPDWLKETHSLILHLGPSESKREGEKESGDNSKSTGKSTSEPEIKPHVQAAEEFFVLPYLGFIQNILGRMRTLVFGILALFIAATLGISSYPFDPLPIIGAIFLILFVMVGTTIIFVYAEMHRDATLSHITNTNPGELGIDFWVRIATFGIPPLIGLLTTLFPSMTDFVVSFLQPGAQAIK